MIWYCSGVFFFLLLTSQSSCLFHDLVPQWCLLFPAVNLAVSRMAKLFTHTLSDFWAETVLATCRGSCSWSPLRACADSRLPFTLPQCWMTTGSSLLGSDGLFLSAHTSITCTESKVCFAVRSGLVPVVGSGLYSSPVAGHMCAQPAQLCQTVCSPVN